MNTALRLVKCPRCRKILPESPNITVYKCGGCGAILQAKTQRHDTKGNDLRPNSVSSSSSPGTDHPFIESSPGSDTRGEQFNSVKPVGTNFSDDYSHLPELNYLQDDKLSPENNKSTVLGEREHPLDQDDARQSESLINITEKPHDRTSGELSDSCDSFYENEDSCTEIINPGKEYGIKGNDLRAQEPDRIQKYEPNSVSSSSSPGGDHHSVESSPESDMKGEQFNSVKPADRNSSYDKLSPEKNESEVQGERERLLDQDAGQRESESLNHRSEKPHERTSGELSASCHSLHENEDSSTEISISGKKYGGYSPKLNVVSSVNEIEDAHGVLAEEVNSSGEQQSLDKHEVSPSLKSKPLKLIVANKLQTSGNEIGKYPENIKDSQTELYREGNHSNELQSLDEPATPLTLGEKNEPSSEDEEHSKVDERRYLARENDRMRQNEFQDQIVEYSQKREAPKETSSFSMKGKEITAARGPLVENNVSSPLTPDDEYLKEFHKVRPIFHRISSEETLDTSPINPRVPIGSMSKSPTRIYYDGDETESSFDGTERLSAQVSRLRKFTGTGPTTTNRPRQKDGFRNKNKQNDEFKMHNDQFNLLSKFKQPNNFYGAESPESGKHSQPMRTSTMAVNNEHISRELYMPRSQLFQGNSTFASSSHNVFLHNAEFRQPDTISDSDPERIELLRMVHELEHKINRTHEPKQMSGDRFRMGGYYDDPTTGINPYKDIKYSGQQKSHLQSIGWTNQYQPRSTRLAFSGEASPCRNHTDCSCPHCYHPNLRFSPKLSSHCIHCQYEAYNTYPSYSPSRQHYSSSETSREIQADDRKHINEIKMSYLREKTEKHLVMKRHLRPVCGGAPIINCYHCSELLQIPADFLLFRKRYHQLRCNACNRILKFSLLEKSHLVPYVIKIQAPPPKEMVDRRTMASSSHPNNHQPAKSGPNGSLPSTQSFQAMKYRKAKTFMEIYQDKNNSSRHNIEAVGASSSIPTGVKPTSEIEEVPATSGSPLHRLMGYASPRHMLFAKSDDDSEDGMGFYMDQHR